MKTNGSSWLSIIIKSIVVFLICAILSLLVLATSATYSLSRNSDGTLTLEGVYVEVKNTNNGVLQYDNSGSLAQINQLALAQSTSYDVQLPYINAAAISDGFYARAKLAYTFYDENDDVLNAVNEATFLSDTFTTYLTFDSNWKLYNGNYYYVTDSSAAVDASNLAQIGGTNSVQNIDIFVGTNHEATIETGTWSTNPEGVYKITISVVLEWVATADVSNWSFE